MSNINISTFVFNKVRIKAKKYKVIYPSLSHMQRLDKASQIIAKKRHFHEVQKLHKNYLFKFGITKNKFLYKCPYCHLEFYPDLDEDIIEHKNHHRNWEMAEYFLNYSPRTYDEREKLKKLGYERISEYTDYSYSERIEGAYMLIHAYFDRSLDDSLFSGDWEEHPTFKEYISLVNHRNVFPKNISKYFEDTYGKKVNDIKNYWFPA